MASLGIPFQLHPFFGGVMVVLECTVDYTNNVHLSWHMGVDMENIFYAVIIHLANFTLEFDG